MAEKADSNSEDEYDEVEVKEEVTFVVKEEADHEAESDEEGNEVQNICQKKVSQCSGRKLKLKEACEKRMLSPSPTAELTKRYPCRKSTKVYHGDVATSDGKQSQKSTGTNACSTHSEEHEVFYKVLQEIGDKVASSSSECSADQFNFVPISESITITQQANGLPEDCDNTNRTDLCALQSITSEDCQNVKTDEVAMHPQCTADADSSAHQRLVPLHINELPALLMSKILSCLTMNELLCTASLVCRTWYQAAREPGLWKRVVLDRPSLLDKDLRNVVRINPNVSQLHLTDCRHLTGSGVTKALVLCSALKELVIMRCSQLEADAFSDIGPNCHQLVRINFSNSAGVTDEAIENIAAHCPNLLDLRLNRCLYITDNCIQKVAKGCPKLKTLTFQENQRITDLSLKALCDHSHNMEVLSLHKCAITNHGITDLHKLTKLRNLDLSNMSSLSPHAVGEAVSNIPQLDTLNLCLTKHINDSCVRCIAASCKKLKYLFLVSCNITDEGLISIGRHSRSIEHIDVGWCQDITDRGATALSQMCSQLNYLGMVRCDLITEECITRLVKEFPHIHYSTFLLDSQRLLEKAKRQGYLSFSV